MSSKPTRNRTWCLVEDTLGQVFYTGDPDMILYVLPDMHRMSKDILPVAALLFLVLGWYFSCRNLRISLSRHRKIEMAGRQ
jgi:hypothetical protein